MSKYQKTVCVCDRCKVEHENIRDSFNVKVTSSNGTTVLLWNDLCPACSHQINEVFKELMIGET